MDLSKASAAAQGLFQIIDRTPTVSPVSVDGKKLDRVRGNLVLRNVTFAYPSRPSIKVLDNLSLEFEAGKTTGIGRLIRISHPDVPVWSYANTMSSREKHDSRPHCPLVRTRCGIYLVRRYGRQSHECTMASRSNGFCVARTYPLPGHDIQQRASRSGTL